MDKWQHIFMGEYAAREKILAGLTLGQVTHLPSKESHSIYDELWHIVRWQNIMVFRDEELYEAWRKAEDYPAQHPSIEQEWHELVEKFFEGVREALEWTSSLEKLAMESDPGITMADNLVGLAVHNFCHFSKIVAIRQMIGAWSTKSVPIL
jgi:hypothetical protein